MIQSAAILIIGDEILNGKIRDTNSYFFTNFLFKKGIEVRKILVVGDYEDEIIEAIKLLDKYDLVITSGGIGPTLDDITYESIAKAFDQPLKLHEETVVKMKKLSKRKAVLNEQEEKAQLRMAIFPENAKVTFLDNELWVPVVSIKDKFYILPGIPQLFEKLLTLLLQHLNPRIESNNFKRYFIKTKLTESQISPFLSILQNKSESRNIKIGSYPHMEHDFNTVSILGREKHDEFIRNLVKETEIALEGEEINEETEKFYSNAF